MKKITICLLSCLAAINLYAGQPASHVDPFIGTDRSDAPTVWEQYGGTYPGAVAPWGAVQLSPETRSIGHSGYFYSDPSILYFTCTGHSSGYPSGSHGSIQVMFGAAGAIKKVEKAEPGYYAVTLADGSTVEMTATVHTGMFRYKTTGGRAVVTIADAGSISLSGDRTIEATRSNAMFVFNQPWTKSDIKNNTLTLEFDRLNGNELLVKLALSSVDIDGSRGNLAAENDGWDFDSIKLKTYDIWNDELSVVQVKSNNQTDLTKFYTALYHSFLLPTIVSDVDGRYRGSDGKIHKTEGTLEYGRFSTWDTFRSLHPLLTLLKPKRQGDMMLSLLHIYDQSGNLPYMPMTGYYSIPVIVDTYIKGITGFDAEKAYRAMKKFLIGDKMPRPDTQKYISDGYLNDSIDVSVSSTLDYAYNDWALSVFVDEMGDKKLAVMLRERSLNYRNLFDVETGFILPRNAGGFVRNPGGMGYKEADKWTASWFVPHDVQGLINLSGGDQFFVDHFNEAMRGHMVFDNETVEHYPYLFSYAGRPDLTCYWVDHTRENSYFATPGGITGNDDLGSMSSWFVFSSMGFFPACPGRPEYVLASPLFEEVVIRLENGKQMKITADPGVIHRSFAELRLNGQCLFNSFITHEQVLEGGNLFFADKTSSLNFTHNPLKDRFLRPTSLTTGKPGFQVKNGQLSAREVLPHQQVYLRFTVANAGETGAFPAIITDGKDTIAVKKLLVAHGQTVTDSVAFRIYSKGKHSLAMSQFNLPVTVSLPNAAQQALVCNRLTADVVVVKKGEPITVEMELQNISGEAISQTAVLYNDDQKAADFACNLAPGKTTTVSKTFIIDTPGFHTLKVLDKTLKVKIYENAMESCVLDVDFNRPDDKFAWDASGFENHGTLVGPTKWIDHAAGKAVQIYTNSQVEFPLSKSLEVTGPTLTVSAWIYPTNLSSGSSSSKYTFNSRGSIDVISKGDYTVFQISGNQMAFFAGGWGRGKSTMTLPDDWFNNWHHIAGVCTGTELKVYLNGKLQRTISIDGEILSTEIPWNLGRNAELPYSRRFQGAFDDVLIFKAALSDEDIIKLYNH